MPSQFDTVLLEMDVEDAERVVAALHREARRCSHFMEPVKSDGKKLRVIASYIALQIATTNRLAAKRNADPQAGGYGPFDYSADARAATQEMK